MTSAQQKRQRWAILLSIVTAILIVAVGATLWFDKSQAEKHQLNFANVKTMIWRRADLTDISFEQHDTGWQINSPCALVVNAQRFEPLLTALASRGERYDAASVDLKAAGLDTPEALLVIDGSELAIGAKDLSGQYRYLQQGDSIALIPEWVLSLINSGLTGVAELSVFNGNLVALTRANSDKDETTAIDPDQLANEELSSLSANQIVSWPITDMPAVTGSVNLNAEYEDGRTEMFELTMTNSFAALRANDSACAHLLEPDAIPDSITP